MEQLKSINTWSKQNRAYLVRLVDKFRKQKGACVDVAAIRSFVDQASDPVLWSLWESAKKHFNAADAGDVLDFGDALSAVEVTPFDDWAPIVEAADALGYDPIWVADRILRGSFQWIEGINNNSDLGKWYAENYIGSNADTDFLAFYVDYDWLGRDIAKSEDIYIFPSVGKALHLLDY